MFNKIFNKAAVVISMVLFTVFLTRLGKVINELSHINTSILKLQSELSYISTSTSTSTSIPRSIDVSVTHMPAIRISDAGGIDVNARVENRIGSFKVTASQW